MLILRYLSLIFMFINILTAIGVIIYLFLNGKKGVLLSSFILTISLLGLLFTSWFASELASLLYISNPGIIAVVKFLNYLPWCFISIPGFVFFMSYAGWNLNHRRYKVLITGMLLLATGHFLSSLHIGFSGTKTVFAQVIINSNLVLSYGATSWGLVVFIRAFVKKFWKNNKFMIFSFFVAAFCLIMVDSFVNLAGFKKFGGITQRFTLNIIEGILIDFILFLLTLATFRYRFLNIIPIAYQNIVASMSEGIMVLDLENRVITVNDSYQTLFPGSFSAGDENQLETVLPRIMEPVEHVEKTRISSKIMDRNNIYYQETIKCILPWIRYFDLKIRPVTSAKGKVIGRVLTWNDVTRHWELNYELNEKNEELTAMNEHLKEHAAVVQELTAARERNRIACDIHDILGHTLTVLITTLEVCRNQCLEGQRELMERLTNATRIARDGLTEIRNFVSGLIVEERNKTELMELLRKVAQDVQTTGIDLEITYDPTLPELPPNTSYNIYRVCKESLTNSLRHGKATRVDIILKQTPRGINLHILDNGIGCKDIKPGHGMSGLKQRISEMGGEISFYSDGEQGFGVKLAINLDGTVKHQEF